MQHASHPLTLGDAKAAMDRGDPDGAAQIARQLAKSASAPGEVAQALHFAGLMELETDAPGPDGYRLIRRALLIAPGRASAHANLAQVNKASDSPLKHAMRAVISNPASPVSWSSLAVSFALAAGEERRRRNLETALRQSKRAVLLRPDYPEAMHGLILDRRWLCSLNDPTCLLERATRLLSRLHDIPGHPLTLFSPHASPQDQLHAAQKINESAPDTARRPSISTDGKLHIGYVCSYLKNHAMAEALPELLSRHDRSRLTVSVYATPSGNGNTGWNDEIAKACGGVISLEGQTPEEQAKRMREDGVDILADLDGFIDQEALELLHHAPAPILLNYFGFPGSCGKLHDYIVGDRRLIPPSADRSYGERIVRLPHCYMPFDNTRDIPAPITRAEAGLPEDEIVFLGFHSQNKMAADAFASWMRCLKGVPGSVLWMLDHGPAPRQNVLEAARLHGVGEERFVFAEKMSVRDHVARLALADLYLDNTWFNAHTTGADALWRGVPVVTVAGETFAARVGASMLTAVGLPDLIARSTHEQADIAIALARSPKRLAAMHSHLKSAKRKAPLFDMAGYTAALEKAFEEMATRARKGLPPVDITISP